VPAADLSYSSTWSRDNSRRLQLAEESLPENDELLGLLYTNLRRADWNLYSLEVFVSIAQLCRQNLDMLSSLGGIDGVLAAARDAAAKQDHKRALEQVDRGLEIAREIRGRRNAIYRDTVATWYKAWYPRVAEANGRHFLHQLDDVKDHVPDRTVDMSFLVYRELLLPLGEWYDQVQSARNHYAAAHQLPALQEEFRWKGLE
jgi:hypothetical protein